ncbi:hypothetical protein LCGC14_1917180, partial [marine sediment metagenome]
SMQFTSARNTHHKHQYRESGFVLVRDAVIQHAEMLRDRSTSASGKLQRGVGGDGQWRLRADTDKCRLTVGDAGKGAGTDG